jgi:hypothetical protein
MDGSVECLGRHAASNANQQFESNPLKGVLQLRDDHSCRSIARRV